MPPTPATQGSSATASTPARSDKPFELPALDLEFASLTEGTDIPPPAPSPIPEHAPVTPPRTPTADAPNKKQSADSTAAEPATDRSTVSGAHRVGPITTSKTTPTLGRILSTSRAHQHPDAPLSPTFSTRSSTMRRLLTFGLLPHHDRSPHGSADEPGMSFETARPDSRGTARSLKRSSGWLSRIRGGLDSSGGPAAKKHATVMVVREVDEDKAVARGPPPPMIPELDKLESKVDVGAEGSLGRDWFKNINGVGS